MSQGRSSKGLGGQGAGPAVLAKVPRGWKPEAGRRRAQGGKA